MTTNDLPEWFFREWGRTALLPSRYAAIRKLSRGTSTSHRGIHQFRIRVILEGQLSLDHSGEKHQLSEGDSILIPPEWHFRESTSPKNTCCFLEIQMEALCSQGVTQHVFSRIKLPKIVAFSNRSRLQEIALLCPSIIKPKMDYEARLKINPILQELLGNFLIEGFKGGILVEKFATPPWLYKLRNMLDEEWNNPTLSLGVLAARFGRSPSSLQHSFKTTFGQTISEYRIQLRIAMAVRILRLNPGTKAEAIARQCGYQNLSLFYRQFKKQTGVTPMAYHPLS